MVAWCLQSALATHRGKRRPHNEDAIAFDYPQQAVAVETRGSIFMVADGVGGLHDGYNASHQTVEQLIAAYTSLDRPPNAAYIKQTIEQINHNLFAASTTSSATTLTAACIYADELLIAHVGDSRAYWVSADGIQQLTIDHVRRVKNKNVSGTRAHLEQAIGYRPTVKVDVIRRPLDQAGALLLVTDGATRHLSDEDMQRIVAYNSPRQAVEAIIRGANQGGGIDNISAVVVQFERRATGNDLQQHLNQVHATSFVLDLPDPLQDMLPKPPQAPKNRSSLWLGIAAASLIIAGASFYAFQQTDIPSTIDTTVVTSPTAQPMSPIPILGPTQPPPTPATAPLVNPPPTATVVTDTKLTLSQTVTFQETEVTYTRIGTDVAAFAIVTARPYTVSDQFTDANGIIWYRLQDTQTSQNGWIQADDLPDYTLFP